MGRLIRRAIHRLIRVLVRARLVVVVLAVLAIVGGIAALFAAGGAPGLSVSAPSLSLPGGGRAPDATESFLKGQQSANADLIWNSFSDEILTRLRGEGVSKADFQRRLEVSQQRGAKLEQINYIGGQSLPDGTSMHFYVVAQRAGPARGEGVDYVPWIFYLNRVGKIDKIL